MADSAISKTKVCFKCGEIKPILGFYKHPQMGDGRLNKCKTCTKKDVAENYRSRREYYAEYEKERFKKSARKEAIKEYQIKRRSRNKEKYSANNAVSNAVRDGKIKKPIACEPCGSKRRIEGHHPDYSRPLDVVWLCRRCHLERHGKMAYEFDKEPTK